MSKAHSYSHSKAHSPTLLPLYLHHSSLSNPSVTLPTSQLILQPVRHFTYITAHSPTLLLVYLHHSSFSNPSAAVPTSQLIIQPFCHFTYVTAHSPTLLPLYLHHSSFSNPSFTSPTSQALHLRHLTSRPWVTDDYDGQMIPRDECGPNFLTFVLQWRKNQEKTSTRN